jgi:hypothetical protein
LKKESAILMSTSKSFDRALQASTATIGAQILLECKKDDTFSAEVTDLLWLHHNLLSDTKYTHALTF